MNQGKPGKCREKSHGLGVVTGTWDFSQQGVAAISETVNLNPLIPTDQEEKEHQQCNKAE